MIIFKNKNDFIDFPVKPVSGFYMLSLHSPIPKIRKIDKKGILYIGKSINLAARLITSKKEHWQEQMGKKSSFTFDHSALTYIVDFDEKGNLIPYKSLIKSGIMKTSDTMKLDVFHYDDCEIKECWLLKGHIRKFGQLPPFNGHGVSLRSITEVESTEIDEFRTFFKKIYKCL